MRFYFVLENGIEKCIGSFGRRHWRDGACHYRRCVASCRRKYRMLICPNQWIDLNLFARSQWAKQSRFRLSWLSIRWTWQSPVFWMQNLRNARAMLFLCQTKVFRMLPKYAIVILKIRKCMTVLNKSNLNNSLFWFTVGCFRCSNSTRWSRWNSSICRFCTRRRSVEDTRGKWSFDCCHLCRSSGTFST